jgi:Cu2+-containing amine oxidase
MSSFVSNVTVNNFSVAAATATTAADPIILDGAAVSDSVTSLQTVRHPTDPLTAAEMIAVNAALRASSVQVDGTGPLVSSLFKAVPAGWSPDNGPFPDQPALNPDGVVYTQFLLKEPIKIDVLAFNATPIPDLKRYARAILNHPRTNETYEAIVKLLNPPAVGVATGSGSIVVTKLTDTMYPNNNYEDWPMGDEFLYIQNPYINNSDLLAAFKSTTNPKALDLKARLQARGVNCWSDFEDHTDVTGPDNTPIQPYCYYSFESFRAVTGFPGSPADLVDVGAPNHRYVPCCFLGVANNPKGLKIEGGEFSYVEGLFVIIDCNNKSDPIYKIVEDLSIAPPALGQPAIAPSLPDPFEPIPHETLKPICVTMPQGPSFTVPANDAHKVHWDNWDFRWSYQRSGLTIYNITYNDVQTGSVVGAPTIIDNGVEVQLGADAKIEGGITKAHAKQPARIKRNIAYKHCSSDTGVVYNSTDPNVARSYVSYDSHNWPIVSRLQSLVLGRDVPGHAKLYPVVASNAAGAPRIIPDAVAIYEQEDDLLWRVNNGVIKTYNWPNGFTAGGKARKPHFTGCRNRQLVVRTLFSGFFYCFVFSYVFNLDGSIQSYCDLYGQTTNQWIARGPSGTSYDQFDEPRTVNLPIDYNADELQEGEYRGELIAKQYVGLTHTHFSMFRTDFMIDGQPNCVDQIDCSHVSMVPDTLSDIDGRPINTSGQVVKVEEDQIKTEDARSLNMPSNRTWRVYNKGRRNRLGHTRGYEYLALCPNGNSTSLSDDNSLAHQKFAFLKNHFHVTKYRPDEEYGAGEFPVLNPNILGMAKYLENNESVDGEDLVCWYNCMFQHHPDTEDYPFISSHRLGMGLYPSHFFGMNPACSLEQNITLNSCGASGFPGSNGLAEVGVNGTPSKSNVGVSGYEKVNALRVAVYPPNGIDDKSITGNI